MVKQCDGVSARFRLLHSRSAMPANVGGGGPAPRFLFRSHRSVSASNFAFYTSQDASIRARWSGRSRRRPHATGYRPQAARRSPLALNSADRIALLHGCNRHCFNGQRLALDIIRLQQKAANTGGICSNRKSTVYLYIYKYMKTVLFISLQRDNCSHPRVG